MRSNVKIAKIKNPDFSKHDYIQPAQNQLMLLNMSDQPETEEISILTQQPSITVTHLGLDLFKTI